MTAATSMPIPTPAPGRGPRRLLGAELGDSGIVLGDALLVLLASVVGFLAVTSGGVKPAGGTLAGLAMVTVALPLLARRSAATAGLARCWARTCSTLRSSGSTPAAGRSSR